MKKCFVLFLLPLLAFNFIADWQPLQMDARATVDFPVKPVEKDMSGNTMWVADIDAQNRCMAMVFDFEKLGMDSAQVAEEFANPESLTIFGKQVMSDIKNGSLISEKSSENSGGILYEYEIDRGGDTLELNHWYNKNYFIGTKMYVLNYFEMTRTNDNPVRERFFQSFKIK